MYHFVYWFFYKFFTSRGNRSSMLASSMVVLAFVIHAALVYTVIHKTTGWTIPYPLAKYEYGERKYILMVMVLPLFYLVDLIYFKRRRLKILSDFEGNKFSERKYIICILLIFTAPIFAFFWLAQ